MPRDLIGGNQRERQCILDAGFLFGFVTRFQHAGIVIDAPNPFRRHFASTPEVMDSPIGGILTSMAMGKGSGKF